MADPEARSTNAGDGAAPARKTLFEEALLAAGRAADALGRALADEPEASGRLRETLRQVAERQGGVEEWQALRRALHGVLAALSPFGAGLRALAHPAVEPAEGRALLQVWQPCQAQLDRLADCEGRLESAGLVPSGEGGRTQSRWGAHLVLLRREVEERLREEAWSVEGLIDLADELGQACNGYLDLAAVESRRLAREAGQLCTHLLGGLS